MGHMPLLCTALPCLFASLLTLPTFWLVATHLSSICPFSKQVQNNSKLLQNYRGWTVISCLDLHSGTLQGSGGFVIVFFIILMIVSTLLIFGIKLEIRGFMLPWKFAMYVVILFQAMFGLWMVFGYYIYLQMVFGALCNWVWMGFNYYCILVVKSHLRNVSYYQSPDIEYLNDM